MGRPRLGRGVDAVALSTLRALVLSRVSLAGDACPGVVAAWAQQR